MVKHSAGILLYRWQEGTFEVFLVHPGGPFWTKKDTGAWSIPKGEFDILSESPLDAAKREFAEETGCKLEGDFIPLDSLKQSGLKTVHAWALEGDCDAGSIISNTFSMEWPPHSGQQQEFPEVDRAGWFDPETARSKILKGQAGFIDRLLAKVQQN
jgi:predicted NUDIX family NTP pyrophosphohydrolase